MTRAISCLALPLIAFWASVQIIDGSHHHTILLDLESALPGELGSGIVGENPNEMGNQHTKPKVPPGSPFQTILVDLPSSKGNSPISPSIGKGRSFTFAQESGFQSVEQNEIEEQTEPTFRGRSMGRSFSNPEPMSNPISTSISIGPSTVSISTSTPKSTSTSIAMSTEKPTSTSSVATSTAKSFFRFKKSSRPKFNSSSSSTSSTSTAIGGYNIQAENMQMNTEVAKEFITITFPAPSFEDKLQLKRSGRKISFEGFHEGQRKWAQVVIPDSVNAEEVKVKRKEGNEVVVSGPMDKREDGGKEDALKVKADAEALFKQFEEEMFNKFKRE